MTNADVENILIQLKNISEDCRILKARMVSLESWMAAISQGKDLNKSQKFAMDVRGKEKLTEIDIERQAFCDKFIEIIHK